MKPVSLVIEGCGPYIDRQHIDFSGFNEGLYLIRGKTGSGKSMIFDCITVALYGMCCDSERGDLVKIRSENAADDANTFIEFVFDVDKKRYKFERYLRKRGDDYIQKQCAYQYIDGAYVPLKGENKRDVDEHARNIIGLDYDQFKQIIILPQGQFEKFLMSKNSEKEDILTALFPLGRFKEYSEEVCRQANELKNKLNSKMSVLTSRLKGENVQTLEQLTDKLVALEKQKKQISKQLTELEKQKPILFVCLQEQLKAQENYNATQQAVQNLNQLTQKQPYYEQLNQRLTKAENSLAVGTSYEEYCDRSSRLQFRTTQLQELIKIHSQVEAEFKLVKEKQEKLDNSQAQQDVQLYQKLLSAEAVYVEHDNAQKQLIELKSRLDQAQQKLNMCADFESSEIIELRNTLIDGQPCPVCGSTSHPYSHEKQVLANGSQADIGAYQQTKRLADELANLIIAKTAQRDVFEKQFVDGIGSLEQLVNQTAVLKDKIQNHEKLVAQLKQSQDNLSQQLKDYGTKIAVADNEKSSALKEFEQAVKKLDSQLKSYGFESAEEYSKCYSSKQEIDEMRTEINNFLQDLTVAKSQVEKLKNYINAQKPDVVKARQEYDDVEKAIDELKAAIIIDGQAIDRLTQLKKVCHEEHSEIQSLSSEYNEVYGFGVLLRGDNSVGLNRYVLQIMMDLIIQNANALLQKVHEGRYQLCVDDKKRGRNKKIGLDFAVFDGYYGAYREASTLSGGEKFLVSLCLSLGLNLLVQSQSRAVRIDTLFVDEGFGSLDTQSLDEAMSLLAELIGSGRSVGVISHVEEMKSTIPYGIEVVKEKTGSIIKHILP